MSPKTDAQKSAKSATVAGKPVKGFTEEERAAMKERVRELKAEATRRTLSVPVLPSIPSSVGNRLVWRRDARDYETLEALLRSIRGRARQRTDRPIESDGFCASDGYSRAE